MGAISYQGIDSFAYNKKISIYFYIKKYSPRQDKAESSILRKSN